MNAYVYLSKNGIWEMFSTFVYPFVKNINTYIKVYF